MAVDDEQGPERTNLLEQLLDSVREEYREEHDEDPPDEVMQKARNEALRRIAKDRRDANRSIYDALAEE